MASSNKLPLKPVAIICLYHPVTLKGKDFFTQDEIEAAMADGWVHSPADLKKIEKEPEPPVSAPTEEPTESEPNGETEPAPAKAKVGRPKGGEKKC
jgi:hypothetical protein